jgi:hypothetical protein
MNGQIHREHRTVQQRVMAAPTISLADALAAARRGPDVPVTIRLASAGRSMAAVGAA